MVVDEFPDGVWLCELAPVREPAAVAHAVAATLSVRPQAGLSLVDSVVDALRGRRLLVILDNCEHCWTRAAELVGPGHRVVSDGHGAGDQSRAAGRGRRAGVGGAVACPAATEGVRAVL